MYAFMRIFSLFLVVVALMLLGGDMITSLEHRGPITVHSFEALWGLFDASGLAASKAWMVRALPGFLSGGIESVLAIPAWSIGVIGVILAFIFGRKHDAA